VFVDVISVSAVFYITIFANCYQNGPQKKARKEAKEGGLGKGCFWEVRNALCVFPLFHMGKIVLSYDQLEL
jgi:hypothetical protein